MSDQSGKPPGGWPPPQGQWPPQPGQPQPGPQIGQAQHFPQQPAPYPPQPPQQPQSYPPPQPYPPHQGQAPYAPPPHALPHAQARYPQQPPPQGFAPHAPPPPQPAAPAPPPEAGMMAMSLGRAMRLRIEPHEVTTRERAALVSANPPVTVPYLQAFLAWRRSVLFLVAIALIPLTILRVHDALAGDLPDQLRFIQLVPAGAEGLLCFVCLYQLKNWTHWRQQRRALMRAWVLFMAAPFIVFLVPVDSIIQGMLEAQAGDAWDASAVDAAAISGAVVAIKATIAIYALLTLAPKAVSLLAGTIRAGIVTKMLFPGTAGPGWIVVLATPLYTLFVFTLLIVPYQLTGSGWYVGAMIALAAAQLALGRAGYRLAKPVTHDEAVQMVKKARAAYLTSMLAFGACLLVALGSLAGKLGVTTIVTTALSFETNVLILTLIGSDLVITSLARARGLQAGNDTTHLVAESDQQLAAFVGAE